ncbi:aspartate kinase [Testudinibacter sp. TR-2022]|uniref:bifunctional aspartate kinase/homoserine dehydrogenase II n=1 Tax=Testudinibacter sp. TR-2022 TaxID=2585029 RepID=UPI00111B9B77|nr:bifunctional aspartate kinase/homoserine dehydrogenase II [Testudinibacter sp. TR-2022]TNH03745.1 aspartate kinase [Pasteurellaceae bacterium Phil31]TNH11688.1 aspartate kinase [Testudinibacter sp. TR-2022]TNH12058.1 aspartate kinase [Testudinibacter sp. TR-2022]TNH15521.1 aspartate kinase [Testudinibacter sp. TR-2022]TNH15645.1 aspartate kinase [Testudinibacter sp. TR-2022]
MKTNPTREMHKFGGSSLANAERIRNVAQLIKKYSQQQDLIVVSAMGDMTDNLIRWVTLSSSDPVSANQQLQKIKFQYLTQTNKLLNAPETVSQPFLEDILSLSSLLDKPLSEAIYAEVVGHGEIWTARLVSAYLNQVGIESCFLDARLFMYAERAVMPQVDFAASRRKLQPHLAQAEGKRLIITGFICQNRAKETVLLGRNGSDYSATQIAALADLSKVTIWSDVAGVYSADPHQIHHANLLTFLRLDEASELSRLAAPVLHARTLQPVKSHSLSLLLRSSLQPENGSTRIEHALTASENGKIVTHHNQIGLIELLIPPTQSLDEWQQTALQWLEQQQLLPLAHNLDRPQRLLKLAYPVEYLDNIYLQLKQLPLTVESSFVRYDMALLAIVGYGVCRNSLQMMRFLQMLKTQQVEFIWQSLEQISVVAILRQKVGRELLRNVHDDLFRPHKSIGLVVLGNGSIAKTWIELYRQRREELSARSKFNFTLIGMVSSTKGWLSYQGLIPQLQQRSIDEAFAQSAQELQPQQLINWMSGHPFDELVVLDITASDEVAKHYMNFAKHGFHVISANKRAAAFPLNEFHALQNAFSQSGSYWFYNATIGSGLPLNTILRDLVESGDTILSVEGTFSDTMTWLFSQYEQHIYSFPELIEQAWQQGLSERNPREDLSGTDAMRKLVIAARSAGYDLDPQQIKVESLLDADAEQFSLSEFFERLEPLSQRLQQRYQDAHEDGMALRYVARFNANGQSSVCLEQLEPDDPISQTLPGENRYLIRSLWYRDKPLVIHGPSSGPAMTAGAIQSDLNRLVKLL